MEIARETIAKHGDRNYFMGGLIKEGSDASEANLNQSYLKGLKELVVHELLKTYINFKTLLDYSTLVKDQMTLSIGLDYLNVSS